MLKILLIVVVCICANIFSSSPLTDKDEVDQYIRRLKEALPGRAGQDCFFNLCVYGNDSKQLEFPHPVYYFVNKDCIAECPKEGIRQILFGDFVYGDLKAIVRGWIENKRDQFHIDLSESPNRAIALTRNCFGLYKREPFLRCLDKPVTVFDSLTLLGDAQVLTRAGMRAAPSDEDFDATLPVVSVTQYRARAQTSRDPRAQAAMDSVRRKLDARRATQKVSVAPDPAFTSTPGVVEEVKLTSFVASPVTGKKDKNRKRKKKKPVIVSTPQEVGPADSEEDLMREKEHSGKDSSAVLMEEDSALDIPNRTTLVVGISDHKILMPADITAMSGIVKGLTSEQRIAMASAYSGTGLTFQQQYDQACRDGLFVTLRSSRSSTPARFAARSVSRPKGRDDNMVRIPTPSSRATSRMRRPDVSVDEVVRSMTPSKMRPLTVSFEGDAEEVYEKYFTQPGNEAANVRYREFLRGVSTQGANYYIGKANPFKSIPAALKINIGDEARIIFKRGEGDSLIIIGNPKHYGN